METAGIGFRAVEFAADDSFSRLDAEEMMLSACLDQTKIASVTDILASTITYLRIRIAGFGFRCEIERRLMLSIRIENFEDAAVLRCVGRIVAGDPIHVLQDAAMCQVGRRLVVLDVAAVDIIDAAGLGSFIFLKTLACVAGMEFKIMNADEHVRELLKITNLDTVFETWLPEDLEIRMNRVVNRPHPSDGTVPDEQYTLRS